MLGEKVQFLAFINIIEFWTYDSWNYVEKDIWESVFSEIKEDLGPLVYIPLLERKLIILKL